MNLETALLEIEQFVGLKEHSLTQVASDDQLGGYHPDPALRKWPAGAVWEGEGKVLYALVRATKAQNCVEIGIQDGCSAAHISSALKANGAGHLDSIDRANSGSLLPNDLRPWVSIIGANAEDHMLTYADNSLDFIFEDGEHSESLGYTIGTLAKSKLRPGGILVAHDISHYIVGADVRAGYDKAGLDYRVFDIDPADTGLMIWRKGA